MKWWIFILTKWEFEIKLHHQCEDSITPWKRNYLLNYLDGWYEKPHFSTALIQCTLKDRPSHSGPVCSPGYYKHICAISLKKRSWWHWVFLTTSWATESELFDHDNLSSSCVPPNNTTHSHVHTPHPHTPPLLPFVHGYIGEMDVCLWPIKKGVAKCCKTKRKRL